MDVRYEFLPPECRYYLFAVIMEDSSVIPRGYERLSEMHTALEGRVAVLSKDGYPEIYGIAAPYLREMNTTLSMVKSEVERARSGRHDTNYFSLGLELMRCYRYAQELQSLLPK